MFESTRPFRREEADAWWVCLDTLRAADRELRAVDALLVDTRAGFRFAAKSVAGVDDPRRLAELVHTDAWTPVDARLHVSDLAGLVERLGGRQLYGDDPHVSLRELIQNAQDAVRARAAFATTGLGSVLVSEGLDGDGRWLAISDDGVGMPVETLTGSLLDFGISGWQSHELADRLPGLLSRGFRPTGRFGIGFTSVFMGNQRVQVVSRALDASAADTNVLEFFNGAVGRPLLRPANAGERLPGPGTTVRIWPTANEASQRAAWNTSLLDDLGHLTAWLCPATQTDLKIRRRRSSPRVARAGDWVRLDPTRLLRRIAGNADLHLRGWRRDSVVDRIRPMYQDGAIVGRAALLSYTGQLGVMTVGGFRVASVDHVAGVVVGHAPNLARDTAVPVATRATLSAWATEQRDLLCELMPEERDASRWAALLHALDVPPGKLPICRTADGPLTYDELVVWSQPRDRIVLFDDADNYVEDLSVMQRMDLTPAPNVVAYSSEAFGSLSWFENAGGGPSTNSATRMPTSESLIRRAIADAWTHYWEIEEHDEPVDLGTGWRDTKLQTEFYVELERVRPDSPAWELLKAEAEDLTRYLDPSQ